MRRVLPFPIVCAVLASLAWAPAPDALQAGRTRTYYVAADEVVWDYLPSGIDQTTGKPVDGKGIDFVTRGPNAFGTKYKKTLYREYTDGTFTTLKPQPAAWEHLGFLGPLLRGVVGDTIHVVFKNQTRFRVSMHPHGVFYKKDSEGAPYQDGTATADQGDDGVAPGAQHVYDWPIPERAGPAHGDGSSILWMYHSHTHETEDVNAGLMGPIIVTARGQARADGSPTDVDKEFVVAFAEVDELKSLLLDDNINTYLPNPADFKKACPRAPGLIMAACSIPGVVTINRKETMNGYTFGNMPMPVMKVGDRVRWYLMSSTNFEFHSPHWHGNTVVAMHMRTDVTSLVPMGMVVADMVPDDPGIWLFHCHVADHLDAGMIARYKVDPK